MNNTVIKIGGMSCQGCVKNITSVLNAMAGVGRAGVSLDAGGGRVGFDAALVSRDALVNAIEDAGFDAE